MAAHVVNVYDAKTNLSRLLDRVERGDEIVIARAGRPIARLVAFAPRSKPRAPGAWRGKVRISADFDTMPEEVAAAFRGERP
ncbi:MAG TPA: type II toxin-antitoxin system prevent-host-death family antitoxin [Acidothermaceae bacterium]|nr:type II toxin-antitoxin system prevent-host-death family antitoxin [Acidothermaceae bacterium]